MLDCIFLTRHDESTKLAMRLASLSCRWLSTALLLVSTQAFGNARPQDISGGAGEGVKRSTDSSSRRRPRPTSQPKPAKRSPKSTGNESVTSQAKVDLGKRVAEALETGNIARDSNPPRYADAEMAYKLAIGIDPTDARPFIGLGNTFFDQKRFPEAETSFRRAIELDPQNADAFIALAFTNNAEEHYDEAGQAAQRALALDANSYPAYAALGWSKYRRKNYQEAEVAYRHAIAISPKTPDLYDELSQVLMDQGRWHDAEPALLQAVTLDPLNASLLSDYAVVLHKLGQLDKAMDIYSQLIKLDATMFAPHSNIALIDYTRGDFVKARDEWEAALRLGSTSELDRTGIMILDRKFGEAQAELEKYTSANATDEDGWLLLGDVRRMQHDSVGASTAHARAAQIAPEYAQLVRPTIPEPTVVKTSPPSDGKLIKRDTSTTTVNATGPRIGATSQENVSSTGPKLRYASSVRTVKATYDARPTPASGAISVRCNPNALVLIEPVGGGEAQMSVVPSSVTVVAFNQLRPGEYLVTASLDGYGTVETRVFVAATKIISIKLTLRPRT